MTEDWADAKIREFAPRGDFCLRILPDLLNAGGASEYVYVPVSRASLAALLRDVAKDTRYEEWQAMQNFRAEVRRVIGDVREHETAVCSSVNTWRYCCDEILKRLESL